jgi:hypothetical protein
MGVGVETATTNGERPMRHIPVLAIFLATLSCGAAPHAANGGSSATAALAESTAMNEWTLSAESTAVGIPAGFGHQVFLKNRYLGDWWLSYRVQDYGINLGYKPGPTGEFTFHRQSGATGPIRFGEPLALHNSQGGFLQHQVRDYGINLSYGPSPSYFWVIKSPDPTAGMVGHGLVGLYNLIQQDYVVYCTRDYGAHLRWARDCNRN